MSKYKQGQILAITYDIWISGTKLGINKKKYINSISIKETVEGADSATIELQDPEYKFLNDNLFLEENTIKIKMGWSGTTYRSVFKGYISSIDIDFVSDGIPKLTFTCMDNTHKMNREKKDRTFENTTSAEVVKKICQENGFKCVVDESYGYEVQETISQSHQSDIEFITKLAGDEVYPFSARLVGDTFYYEKIGKLQKTPKMTLTYKKYPHEVISFSPKLNKESKQVEIKEASINTGNKKVSSTTGTSGNKDKNGSANSGSSKNKSDGSYTYDPQTKKWNKN